MVGLEKIAEERRRPVRVAGNLVRCLAIEFEIQFSFGLAVVSVGKMFELAPSQLPLRERGAPDGDAHTRRLPGDTVLLRDRLG